MATKTQFRATLWLLIFIAPWLVSCGEVVNEYYISNHTDASLTVRFTPFYIETVALSSGPLIDDIRRSAHADLPQAVPFDQQEDVIQFEIPAKTSVFLGISGGGHDLFSHLEVQSSHGHTVMNSTDYGNYFAVHDYLIGAVVHVFNVN